MGLLRSRDRTAPAPRGGERRITRRGLPELLAMLVADDPDERRWAARDLAAHPESCDALVARLGVEMVTAVRDALLQSLVAMGSPLVVTALLPFLRSDDAALRNAVVGALRLMPDEVAPRMPALLADADADVRLLALEVLDGLRHPDAATWLVPLLDAEQEVNVLGAAVDCCMTIDDPAVHEALTRLAARGDALPPYLRFAIDTVLMHVRWAGPT